MSMSDQIPLTVKIHDGKIYLSNIVYETYFKNIQSIVFLEREKNIYLLPVNQAGGSGLLLKIINAKGDRVINVPEQLLGLGIDEVKEYICSVKWDATISGLNICMN